MVIERYAFDARAMCMETNNGNWVRYTDYAAVLARFEALRAGYAEAIEDIEDWAGYASDYFRDKHDLEGTLAAHRATLSAKET